MSAEPGDNPGVVAMPPFILLAFIAAGLIINFIYPLHFVHGVFRYAAGALFLVVSGVIVIAAHAVMRKAGTNANVRKPATVIVTGGVYRYTRNPMYLAMIFLLIGLSLLLNNLWILIITPIFIRVMQKGVIEREESYLEKKFGSGYAEYKKTARRWI